MEIDSEITNVRLALHELATSVSEFNRLAVYLATEGLYVQTEVLEQSMPNGLPNRPTLAINVVAPL